MFKYLSLFILLSRKVLSAEIFSIILKLLLVKCNRILDDGYDLSLGQVVGKLFEFVWCKYLVSWITNFSHSYNIFSLTAVDNLIISPWPHIILDRILILST